MKIALIGYGKMGKEIEKIALSRNHSISGKIDENNSHHLNEILKISDVAIEFTQPNSVLQNILSCFSLNVPVVVGTTGWDAKRDEIIQQCKNQNQTLFYASNFSVGVNLFFEANRYLAQLMNRFKDYEINLEEIHHIHKKDAPSGTAITLAETILQNLEGKNGWILSPDTDPSKIAITAKRIDEVPGTHSVFYENEIDKITFTHEAKNRKGFALGAVLAAEFVQNKKGCYQMKDLLNI